MDKTIVNGDMDKTIVMAMAMDKTIVMAIRKTMVMDRTILM